MDDGDVFSFVSIVFKGFFLTTKDTKVFTKVHKGLLRKYLKPTVTDQIHLPGNDLNYRQL